MKYGETALIWAAMTGGDCYILCGARSQQGSSGPSKYTSTTYDNDDDDDDDDCIYTLSW